MPETFDLSRNFELELIGPDKLSGLVENDPLLMCMPPAYSDTSLVLWEQPENGYGLLSLRGQDGEPDVTDVPGYRQMRMAPGYYGEKVLITEAEMNEAREYGTPNEPLDVEKRLGYIQDQILRRAVDRMRLVASTLLRTGQFLVANTAGSVSHTDTLDGYAARNLFSPSVSWAETTWATATPIANLLQWQAQLQLGTDSVFDEDSELLASDLTIRDILNTNEVKAVIKSSYGATLAGLKPLNEALRSYGLPQLVRYNEDYYASRADAKARTSAVRFIPHKSLIWKGYRKDGAVPANFQLTRNAVKNPPAGVAQNAPGYRLDGRSGLAAEIDKGLYQIVQYRLVPAQYSVDIGLNGGPAVRYPSAFAGISYS